MHSILRFSACCCLLAGGFNARSAVAADKPEAKTVIEFADGHLQVKAPPGWVRKQPLTSIVEHEFALPAVKPDANDGRMTLMAAGGGVEANIDRWYGQFSQPDGGSTRDRAKVKQIKVGGADVHLVDISGTFKDQRGPAAPAVERPKYRMLGAIIPTKGAGTYFIKVYGPERTMADNEKAFLAMIESLQQK